MPELKLRLNIAPPNFPLGIALNGVRPAELTEPVYADVYGRFDDEPGGSEIHLGSAVAGGTVVAAGVELGSRPFRLFMRPRTSEKQIESVTDLRNAVQTVFSPNTESLVPVIWESQASTNTRIFFQVGNYSANAKYRQIQWSLASNFSSPTDIIQDTTNEASGLLSPDVSIERSTNLASVETRYIRVRHSSNGATYGDWSTPTDFNVTFANSGGSGGSGGDTPPPVGGSCFAGETIYHLYDEEITFYDFHRRYAAGFYTEAFALSFNADGEQVAGRIKKVFKVTKKEWLYIEFSDREKFEVTPRHKFYTENGNYVAIEDIEIGTNVVNADGTFAALTKKEPRFGIKEFYNTHIETFMNYCVGKTKKRVHNLKDIEE